MDFTLINKLTELAKKEKKIEGYKRRLHVKGIISSKNTLKSGNIKLHIKEGENDYSLLVLKTHKDRFALAEKLSIGDNVSCSGIRKLRMIICTRLKKMEKGRQKKLDRW